MRATMRWAMALAMTVGCVEWARTDGGAPDVATTTDVATADTATVDGGSTDAGPMDVPGEDAQRADVPTMDMPMRDAGADVTVDAPIDRPTLADVQDAGVVEDRGTVADVPADVPARDVGADVPGVDVPPDECTTGATRSCYTGPDGTAGMGICVRGMQSCVGGRWETACAGQVVPLGAEVCGNAADDDCDGMLNEGCAVTCAAGTSDCDTMSSNGCEVVHSTAASACGAGGDLATWCGDTTCGGICTSPTTLRTVRTETGNRSAFFRGRIADCAGCAGTLSAQITLAVPAGVDYDLYVHRPCGTISTSSATVGAGMTERVSLSQSDALGTNESFDYVVEVRWRSGASCALWTLTLEARANSATTCP